MWWVTHQLRPKGQELFPSTEEGPFTTLEEALAAAYNTELQAQITHSEGRGFTMWVQNGEHTMIVSDESDI